MKKIFYFLALVGLMTTVIFASCKCYTLPWIEKECEASTMKPCINDCRFDTNAEGICSETPVGEKPRYFKCDELIVSFEKDKFQCNKIVDSLKQELVNELENQYGPGTEELCKAIKKEYIKQKLDQLASANPGNNFSEVKKCLCDKEIYIYQNSSINAEDAAMAMSSGSGVEGEGGTVSLNYIITNDGDLPPAFGISRVKKFNNTIESFYNRFIPQTSSKPSTPIVAFLDSGIDPDVFDYSKYISLASDKTCIKDDHLGYNFVDDNNITYDSIGHGTLVALSFKDVLDDQNADYRVLPVKVLDDCGTGTIYSTVCGIYYAAAKGANIINTSWGLYFHDPLLEKAVEEVTASKPGIKIVASSGNRRANLQDIEHYPSGYDDLNTSSNYSSSLASKNVYEVSGLCLDISANCAPSCALLWGKSNYNMINITEPAFGYENLINAFLVSLDERPVYTCSCSGTSYAAPRITAALVNEFNSSFGQSIQRYTLNPAKKINSYWLNPCDD